MGTPDRDTPHRHSFGTHERAPTHQDQGPRTNSGGLMSTIAMTREMGSLGKDVAEGLAGELGLRLLYHEIIDSVAEKMHLPANVITRFLQGKAGRIESLRADFDSMSLYTAEEVLEIAAKGNLMIRGWGATCLLRPVSHVLCVRVCAPMTLRVQRIMDRVGIQDPKLAQTEIERSDAAHAAAMLRRFGISWQDAAHYDLVLNTERLSVGDCIQQIKDLLASPSFQETAESRARLHHLTLLTHVQSALRRDPKTREVRISLDEHISGTAGNMVLRGIVLNDAEKSLVENLATRFPGVSSVENQLQVQKNIKIARKLDG